jgi:uncharacterized protein YndB with AHSA1/START domain
MQAMKWLKRVLAALGVLLLVFVVGGLLLPAQVEVQRSIRIERPPSQVFAALNGFARFNEWSPWADYDTTARHDLSGPPSGVGARLEWVGERGSGAQQIVQSVPDELIVVDLDFGSGGGTETRYLLTPDNGGTHTVWQLRSELGWNPLMRWMGLGFGRMIGPDFERGLASLKRLLEADALPSPQHVPPIRSDGFEATPDTAETQQPDADG